MSSAGRNYKTSSIVCPVMVGRERELVELQQAWQRAGEVAVVRGGAGIGKSRLVREFSSSVQAAGGTVLAGRCIPTGADVPFRPLREALLAAARTGLRPSQELEPFWPALGSLVPEWLEGREASLDTGSVVLAEGVLRLIVEWSARKSPTLLLIEDLHWSDRETLDVAEYLADNLAGHPALLLATLRDGEAGLGPELVDGLLARRVAHPIDLQPLDPKQSETMLRECLGAAALTPDLIAAVVSRSDGVPFFIEELLATALRDARSERVVPISIGAALEARLASLPGGAVHFLRYAALLGRQFDWHVVSAAFGCPRQEAIELLRQAVHAQLIDPDGTGFRFRHALTVEAVQSSLFPEERRDMSLRLSRTLEALHPGLEGERCQLAANLSFDAGDTEHAADLWLEASRRALKEGSLASAEALALRAHGRRPVEADRILLATWAIGGQPGRALEAGHRILSSEAPDLALQTEVRFDLVDAMIAAGRWDDADNYLQALRSSPGLDRSGEGRRAIGQAELALGRNDKGAALEFARTALAGARDNGDAELTCRALWVIGRVERGRDTAAASAAFEEAHDCALRHGLTVVRVKSLVELGIIDMFEKLATTRLEEARQEALATGALSTVAMVDLQLAATYSCRGQAGLTLASARRSEDISRHFGLASLRLSLALQAVAHGFSGDRTAMEAGAAQARATGGDSDTVELTICANGVALYHLGEGQAPEALDALDGAMEVLRAVGGGAHPFPGRWALLRTVIDDGGAEAREECRSLSFDTAMSRATLQAADAVAAGRAGTGAEPLFAAADRALGGFEGGFLRSLARLLAAPCAFADGWGAPAVWLREALANFEDLGLPNFAGQCRSLLRAMGEPVPRRPRGEGLKVPDLLAGLGVTSREAEVLAQLAAGRSNREIAETLHLSVRTVEKHVERLLMKTGQSRAELARLADRVGLPPAV